MTYRYKGKRSDTKEWVYGWLIIESLRYGTKASIRVRGDEETPDQDYEVYWSSVCHSTGLQDKTGKEIYQGDIVQIKTPVRTTQTHTGNNIPNGSYTEPMEPGIETKEEVVEWKDGMFILDTTNPMGPDMYAPLLWDIRQWDEDSIKQAIAVHKANWSIWDDPEEGDLQYLLEEYKYSNLQEMIDDISGIKVIGNIHDK